MVKSLSRREFVALVGASAVILAGCSSDYSEAGSDRVRNSSKADDVSNGMYDVGLEVVEVGNNYLDGYLSSETASEELDDLVLRAEEIDARSEESGDSYVCNKIEVIQSWFALIELKEDVGYSLEDTEEDLEEDLEELEEHLYNS